MKQIELFWRNPEGSIVKEIFDTTKFRVHTESGFVKIYEADGELLMRILPAYKIELVQFVEREAPPVTLPALPSTDEPKAFKES